jgi:hypothetical protein
MRPLFFFLALAVQTAAAATFPSAALPEQPVSGRAFGPAAGNQQTLAIASNGTIGFAVWLDQRSGTTDLYGSRIDANGVSLDPLGILIAPNATGGTVIWNGSQFVIVSERGIDKTFTFMTTGGIITGRTTKTMRFMSLAATMGSGFDARILFLGVGRATIVDSDSNYVVENVQLAMPASPSLAVAGAGANEFLVLHTNAAPGTEIFADRIDRNGNFLGTTDAGIDLNVIGSTLALAGSNDGYLLVGRGGTEREVIAVHLNPAGVTTSVRTLRPFQPGLRVSVAPPDTPAIFRDGDHYEVSWTTSEPGGDAHAWRVAEPATVNGQDEPVRILDWTGSGYGTVIAKIAVQEIIVTDSFRAGVATSIDQVVTVIGFPQHPILASSATKQTTPQVAVSGIGYAVLWNEFGPDGLSHLYVRRFTAASGASIVEVASNANVQPITGRIAAARGTYVIAWTISQSATGTAAYLVRRMSAATGEWLDAAPVALANAYEVFLASNGDSVLAAYTIDCSDHCPRARSIAPDTMALFRGAEMIVPGTSSAFELSLTSNGSDYLLAWNDNPCTFPCDVPFVSRLLALRLDASGRAIDSRPFVIDDTHAFSHSPSVAWTGSNYAVTWDAGDAIDGRHVSASGITDPIRIVYPRPSQLRAPFLIAHGNDLFLFFTSQTGDVISSSAVALDPQTMSAIGDASVLVNAQPANATISAAALPDGIVAVYDRIDAGGGNVGRVFARIYGAPSRHRAVHR